MTSGGERTRGLLEAVLDLLCDRLPDEVTVRLHSGGRWAKVKGPAPADRVLRPDDRDYDWATRALGLADGESVVLHAKGSYTGALVRGLGTWLPFVPRPERARMAALDALETISRSVRDALGEPWPTDDASAFSECDGLDRYRVHEQRWT